MKANELRIGNWILNKEGNPNPDRVTTISVFGGLHKCSAWKPIPLTEQWLLDFGFKTVIHKYYKKPIVLFGDSEQYPNGATFVNGNDISVNFPLHVHTLQNLYFALTGKELTLN